MGGMALIALGGLLVLLLRRRNRNTADSAPRQFRGTGVYPEVHKGAGDIGNTVLLSSRSHNDDRAYSSLASTDRILGTTSLGTVPSSNSSTPTKAELRRAILARQMEEAQHDLNALQRQAAADTRPYTRDDEVEDMRVKLQQLHAEIARLKEAQNTQWVQGLSDVQPPVYTERVS